MELWNYISQHPEFQQYFNKRKKQSVTKKSQKKSHMRFETASGQQAQLDWKESMKFQLKSGETNIFVLLLSCFRFRVYRLSLFQKPSILFSFLDDTFQTFCGVPHELLTDNMKTVMEQAWTYKCMTITCMCIITHLWLDTSYQFKKLNYLEKHYVSISKLTLNSEVHDIDAIAKNNLN